MEEIPPISTFPIFWETHRSASYLRDKMYTHTYGEHQLGYNVCEGPFISP